MDKTLNWILGEFAKMEKEQFDNEWKKQEDYWNKAEGNETDNNNGDSNSEKEQ